MFAIIADGGQQFRVEKGTVLWCQKKDGAETGAKVEFPVLLVADGEKVSVGTPHVSGARVVGEVVEHARGDKIVVFKYQNTENYHRKRGHRQDYTAVRITDIQAGG